jgi:hypothetical protein
MRTLVLTTLLVANTSMLCAFDLGDVSNAVSSMQTTQKTAPASKQQSNSLTSILSSQLGINDKQASGGVGSILSYAKEHLDSDKFSTLSNAIPNAGSLLAMAPKASQAMSGLSALSGSSSAGGLASLASQFSSLGMNSSMISKFVPIIVNYLKSSNSNGAASILSGLF